MKITGVDKLKRKLAQIPKVARAEIRQELDKRAAEIANTAKNFAPVDSGALRKSIGYTFGKYEPENSQVRGTGGGGRLADDDLSVSIHAGDADAFYAAFVEFGTAPHAQPNHPYFHLKGHPGASARPFFFPAFRLGKKRAKSGIARATRRAALKVAKGGK